MRKTVGECTCDTDEDTDVSQNERENQKGSKGTEWVDGKLTAEASGFLQKQECNCTSMYLCIDLDSCDQTTLRG